MTERRYGDEQVREIFSLATTGDVRDGSLPVEPGGLTLAELQRIGHEAGIEPARVAHAAQLVDSRGQPATVQRALGMAVGVSRVIELPRAPNDQEWELMITQFRTTFGVQGQPNVAGGFREWSHGNLHISVEPTQGGQQLRLTTRNEAAVALNGLGIVTGGMSLLMAAGVTAAGKVEKALPVLIMLGGIALATFAANVIRSPRWARERDEQMLRIAEHTTALLSGGSD